MSEAQDVKSDLDAIEAEVDQKRDDLANSRSRLEAILATLPDNSEHRARTHRLMGVLLNRQKLDRQALKELAQAKAKAEAASPANFDELIKIGRETAVVHAWRGDDRNAARELLPALFRQDRPKDACEALSVALRKALEQSNVPLAEELRTDMLKSAGADYLEEVAQAIDLVMSGALADYDEGLGMARKLLEKDSANPRSERDVAFSLDKVGDVKLKAGDAKGALGAFEEGLGLRKKIADTSKANYQYQRDVLFSLNRVGDAKVALGDVPGGLPPSRSGLPCRAISQTRARKRPRRKPISWSASTRSLRSRWPSGRTP